MSSSRIQEPQNSYNPYNTRQPDNHGRFVPSSNNAWSRNGAQYEMKPLDPAYNGQGNFHRFVSSIRGSKKNKTCFFIGLFIFILILGGAIAAAAILIPKSRKDKTIHYETDADGYIVWNKDPSLVRSFYGIGYTSESSQYPYCGLTQEEVIEDVKILSQLTHRIRLYGMDCHQAEYTLEAVRRLKADTKVTLTIWVDDNDVTYKRQYDEFFRLLQKYGTNYIDAVSVGNEMLFREEVTRAKLYQYIADVRSKVQSLGYNIPVSTTELGTNYNAELLSKVDVGMANIHPYFGGTTAENAANWTFTYLEEEVKINAKQGQDVIISEVGWPTEGASEKSAVASVKNQQRFMNDFVCEANRRGVKYYWFEALDLKWKTKTWTVLEGHWGMFDEKKKAKITLPNCPLE
ncbi:glycoside hydrolase [Basidiobolus meristosporus CBS 931.73]|uniref:glucan endo-1,3-beta-D-glucosidase n=1 Tax=Basidiobolus meristosporus CBS 931.73 TaxID=1314790 RepID=A0A1Y1YSU2_9FUNG|nr:glycoside hydrolase [Basidiobolus meristosporus CBS 931.73]|eukprot:ORY01029.1 glycoside hydrolase [Basidiobolus meristosporus CBS 931.73]